MIIVDAKGDAAELQEYLRAGNGQPVAVRANGRLVAVVSVPLESQTQRDQDIQALREVCERLEAHATAAGLTPEVLDDILRDGK